MSPNWFLRIWTWEQLPSKVGPCKYSIATPNLLLLLPFIVRNCRDGVPYNTLALGPGAELDSGQLGITSKVQIFCCRWIAFLLRN